jgi:glycosyltransferase involved in cell wall biosynthesis
VDTNWFSPQDGERDSHVMSVGGFHHQKGFRFLVRALAHVREETRPPLVLVGDRSDPGEVDALHELAEQRGVRLTTHQRIGEEALRDLYRRARLFLYAPYLEPLGLVALEAMACGTPVLGVREGGVRETVVERVNGRLVERDEAGFARVLQEMLADPSGLQELGRQAREYVSREWTWGNSVEDLLRLFREAQSRPAAS